MSASWEEQRRAADAKAHALLAATAHRLPGPLRASHRLRRHVLPPAGGASGASSLLAPLGRTAQRSCPCRS